MEFAFENCVGTLYKGKTQTCEKFSEVLGWLSG